MNSLIPPPGFYIIDQNIDEDCKIIYDLCKILMMKPVKKNWVPSENEIKLFHIIIDKLNEYTLGQKEYIGLRQLLKNKIGEEFVSQFNKLLSSRSLLWKDPYVCCTLNECLNRRSSKFKLIVKEENQMFFLCKPSILPNGFYAWNPSF